MFAEWVPCCWQSYLPDTQVQKPQKWRGEDRRGLESACVLEWASFYSVHEIGIFESLLAGEKTGLWGSLPVEETLPITLGVIGHTY